jgi:uncharacterized RDD family membrane protein YckC
MNNDIEKLQLASTQSRMRAFIVDDLFITFLIIIAMWDTLFSSDIPLVTKLSLISDISINVLILKFVYQTFFIWYYGATLGKMVAKIKTIDYDHFGKVSLLNASLRSLARLLSELVYYLGFFLAYFQESKQTLHDKIGRTLVVYA